MAVQDGVLQLLGQLQQGRVFVGVLSIECLAGGAPAAGLGGRGASSVGGGSAAQGKQQGKLSDAATEAGSGGPPPHPTHRASGVPFAHTAVVFKEAARGRCHCTTPCAAQQPPPTASGCSLYSMLAMSVASCCSGGTLGGKAIQNSLPGGGPGGTGAAEAAGAAGWGTAAGTGGNAGGRA